MMMASVDSFAACISDVKAGYHYFSLPRAAESLGCDLAKMPFCLRVLLENLLRYEDGKRTSAEGIKKFVSQATGLAPKLDDAGLVFYPTRILMQDFTGVPAIVDLASLRDEVVRRGGKASDVVPRIPVDLVIDHSVSVDHFGQADSEKLNVGREFERNQERYDFLRWGQQAFDRLRVVPPGMGICHQVNLEYLSKVVWTQDIDRKTWVYPDSVLGTDSHTTMVNGLGVLGWGVGGIEAEAAMLGLGLALPMPAVVLVKLEGTLSPAVTATDLVLTVTQRLRQHGVVAKFVEFSGSGYDQLSVADRATVANMAPEYGATCGFFPVDAQTCAYLSSTGRTDAEVERVEEYARRQHLWRDSKMADPVYADTLSIDMDAIVASIAGPKRPQDRIALTEVSAQFAQEMRQSSARLAPKKGGDVIGKNYRIEDGHVVLASITSCTNTSNPVTMMTAGLLARNAVRMGLRVKPWVKTSLAPGSQVVTAYLEAAGLIKPLADLGFWVVGYGCTTCIGNSGPLADPIAQAIHDSGARVASVLSGNRNFEGRIHPLTTLNYLASPPLVIVYALTGTVAKDVAQDPIGMVGSKPVHLVDIWPDRAEVMALVGSYVQSSIFIQRYLGIDQGSSLWQAMDKTQMVVAGGCSDHQAKKAIHKSKDQTYAWDKNSTYVRRPSFFEGMDYSASAFNRMRPLVILGDSVTTDHISPAGSIALHSPAAVYLRDQGVAEGDFNSYGSRRGNHEVMARGTFANIRIRNAMVRDVEGGVTKVYPEASEHSIYDAAMIYAQRSQGLIVIAGKEYGSGSSRDWAAKGVRLLGVRVVLAQSFERIHRSNLIGMGVLPLQFTDPSGRAGLNLQGSETFSLIDVEGIAPGAKMMLRIYYVEGTSVECQVVCRIDTQDEMDYYRCGGILPYVCNHYC